MRGLLRHGAIEGPRNRKYLRHKRSEPADRRKARWKNFGSRVDLRPAAIGDLRREHNRGMASLDQLDNMIPGAAMRDHDLVAIILVVAVDADRLAMIHREHDSRAVRREPRVEDARERLHVIDAAARKVQDGLLREDPRDERRAVDLEISRPASKMIDVGEAVDAWRQWWRVCIAIH